MGPGRPDPALPSRVTVLLQAEDPGLRAPPEDGGEHAPGKQDVSDAAEAVAGKCQARSVVPDGDLRLSRGCRRGGRWSDRVLT